MSCKGCLSTGDYFPRLLAPTFHPVSPQGLWENHIQGFCLAFLLEKQIGFLPPTALTQVTKVLLTGISLCIILALRSPCIYMYISPKMYTSINALHLTIPNFFSYLNFGPGYGIVSFSSPNVFFLFGSSPFYPETVMGPMGQLSNYCFLL